MNDSSTARPNDTLVAALRVVLGPHTHPEHLPAFLLLDLAAYLQEAADTWAGGTFSPEDGSDNQAELDQLYDRVFPNTEA